LSPRVVAEARGWRDIVEDIDDVLQTPVEIEQAWLEHCPSQK
jgi:hypothetical protein